MEDSEKHSVHSTRCRWDDIQQAESQVATSNYIQFFSKHSFVPFPTGTPDDPTRASTKSVELRTRTRTAHRNGPIGCGLALRCHGRPEEV
jgi:hypothetical protein